MMQNNSIADMLNSLDADALSALLAHVDEKNLCAGHSARIRKRVEKRLGVRSAQPGRTLLRVLLPVAAFVAVLAVLFSIPSVSHAVSDWFYETFQLERYFMKPSGERDARADVEKAVFTPSPVDQAFTLRYLDELPFYHDADAYRTENGFQPFDRADYAWIADLVPTSEEALYDGAQLIVNLSLNVSPLKFIAGYTSEKIPGAERFDIWAQTARITIDGVTEELLTESSGLTIPWVYSDRTGKYDVDALRAAETSCVQTVIASGETPAFPSAPVTVEIDYNLYDGEIDDMGSVGIVAVITEKLTFDASRGNHLLGASSSVRQRLSGSAPLLVRNMPANPEDDPGTLENRVLDFSCCTVAAAVTSRTTGLALSLTYEFDNEADRAALLGSFCENLAYDLYVNGVLAERLEGVYGYSADRNADMTYEISLTPSEYENVSALSLRPVALSLKGVQKLALNADRTAVLPDGPFVALAETDTYQLINEESIRPEWRETPLTNCDIPLPFA